MYESVTRFISRLTNDTLALVLAGGRGERLGALTDWRTKPAVPFGGKFRIIDFTLSNCVHSGLRKICLLTQYKSHSLIQHVMRGWTYLSTESGNFLDVIPAQQWTDDETWFQGTADAVYQCLDIIEGYGVQHILILAGDHVYNMDYGEMLAEHVTTGADFTIACLSVPVADAANQLGVMEVDEDGRIVGFEEKPAAPKPMPDDSARALVSMGIYITSQKYLSDVLRQDASDTSSSHDFGNDIIPKTLTGGHHLQAHRFLNPHFDSLPYWRDVGTIDAYFQANLELLSPNPPLDLYDPSWPTLTYQPQLPPAHFTNGGRSHSVENSMVSGGCIVEASRLHHSILFSNVRVHLGCELDSVLALPGCEIGTGSKLTNVILDNGCQIPDGAVIGANPETDRQAYHVTENGVVLVNRKLLGQGDRYEPGILPQGACQPDGPK